MYARPLVLGIETSCDDTACAVVDGEGRVLASSVSSQLAAHRPYGGVVPEIASREHLANWPQVAAAALEPLALVPADVDLIAATRGPGLVGSLLVGLSLGKALAFALGRPFYGVHHLEGHLWSPFLGSAGAPAAEPPPPPPEQLVALVVSGGHTALFHVERAATRTLAETRDDAMGEVFDKLGKRLGLPYPQGPLVDRLAEEGDPTRFPLPVPRAEAVPPAGAVEVASGERVATATATAAPGTGLWFSYSGLKSAAVRHLERLEREGLEVPEPERPPQAVLDLLASFRAAAVAQVIDRVDRLHRARPFPLLAVSGGVAANRLLRRELTAWAAERGVDLRLVALSFAGDNAAMIAFAALQRHRRGDAGDPLTVEAASRVPLT